MLENYSIDKNGVIYQINKSGLCSYDEGYINKFVRLGLIADNMSHLRLGNIIGSIKKIPGSILDVGYGDGNFLKKCTMIEHRFGFDVSGYPIPEKCTLLQSLFEEEVEVTTFFDSLEHFDDPYIIKDLKSEWVFISVPECHYFSDVWFLNWKHLRPNEHLWHFNKNSLQQFMLDIGYKCHSITNIEDTIRKPEYNYTNIITGAFYKI